jgi:hypothetical protein
MDIWVGTSEDNITRLEQVLQTFGLPVAGLFADLVSHPGRVWRFGVVPLRIEVLTKISGIDFNSCYPRRLTKHFEGVLINLIDVNDLKTNKRTAGRPKDLADLDGLP